MIRLYLMKFCDVLIFYTDPEVREYQIHSGVRKKPFVFALNNGLNIDPINANRVVYTSSLRAKRILFIGRLTEKAKVEQLIDALQVERLSDVHLDIIGDGEQYDQLVHLADKLNLLDRVVFHGALINEYEISKIANSCRIFVYPGEVGLSLIHGMAYGLPVIVHSERTKHMPEFSAFRPEAAGVVFEYKSPESLAKAILDLIDDLDRLDQYSAQCVKTISESYNTNDMANRFVQFTSQYFQAGS